MSNLIVDKDGNLIKDGLKIKNNNIYKRDKIFAKGKEDTTKKKYPSKADNNKVYRDFLQKYRKEPGMEGLYQSDYKHFKEIATEFYHLNKNYLK